MISRDTVLAITGATGFIGGRLARTLVARGYRPRLLVRSPNRLAEDLWPTCEVVAGDLGDPTQLAGFVTDAELIFHCAANVTTWASRGDYEVSNVLGVVNLLKAIARYDKGLQRFVHLSSMDVYGFPLQPCDEQTPLNGAGFPYGESKVVGEAMVRKYGESHGIPYTILRPGNVIGPGSQYIRRIGKELKSGIMLTIDGGRANGGFLYVDNLVEVMLWAAQSLQSRNEVYNVRDHYDISWKQFISILQSGTKGKGLIIDMPYWLAEANARVWEWIFLNWMPHKEPLLHTLLVRFFGRTCGHLISKLQMDYDGPELVGFSQAMERSIQWLDTQP